VVLDLLFSGLHLDNLLGMYWQDTEIAISSVWSCIFNSNFKRVELYFLFFDFVHAFHFDGEQTRSKVME
jgi:hypothetical protein